MTKCFFSILDNEYLILKTDTLIIKNSEKEILLYRKDKNSIKFNTNCIQLFDIFKLLQKGINKNTLIDTYNSKFQYLNVQKEFIENIVEQLTYYDFFLKYSLNYNWGSKLLKYFDKTIGWLSSFEDYTIHRHNLFLKLRESNIMLIGLGSFGSVILQNLIGTGIGTIIGVDGDHIELSNLSRQSFYKYSDIGKLKVEVAQETVKDLSPYTEFISVNKFINSTEDLLDIINNLTLKPDVIILTADNPPFDIVKWVTKASIINNISLIRGNREFIGPLMIPNISACPLCNLNELNKTIPRFDEIIKDRKEGLAGPSGTISTILSILGTKLVDELLKFLLNLDDIHVINNRLKFDHKNLNNFTKNLFPKDQKCTTCCII